MRHDADELIGALAAHDGTAVHEQVLAAGDEGVERGIVDDVDMHRFRVEARDMRDWRRVSADDILDLGIAQQADVLRAGLSGQRQARDQQNTEHSRQNAHHRLDLRSKIGHPAAARQLPVSGAGLSRWRSNSPGADSIPPFIAMDVLRAANERAAAGYDVLHLEVGQPATRAPARVLAAAQAALERETLGYTDALGLPALREAIAAHYRESHGLALDAARVVVTTGSSGAFILAFLAAFDPGDRIALASPSYPAYRNILTALDLVPVELPVGPPSATR